MLSLIIDPKQNCIYCTTLLPMSTMLFLHRFPREYAEEAVFGYTGKI